MSVTVETIFDEVRIEMNDENANVHTNSKLVVPLNILRYHINLLVIRLGSELGMKTGTITTDGTNQAFELPSDFAAFVMDAILPRNPITATADYTHGCPMPQLGSMDRRMYTSISAGTTNTPTAFTITISGTTQSLKFNVMPPSGSYYDYWYWPTLAKVTASNVGSTIMPYLDLLNNVMHSSLVTWCRDHEQFTPALEREWRQAAIEDAHTILGLRRLHDRSVNPSIWRNFPWR